jgi:hypothetical protein
VLAFSRRGDRDRVRPPAAKVTRRETLAIDIARVIIACEALVLLVVKHSILAGCAAEVVVGVLTVVRLASRERPREK